MIPNNFVQSCKVLDQPTQIALTQYCHRYALLPEMLMLCCWYAQHHHQLITAHRIRQHLYLHHAWVRCTQAAHQLASTAQHVAHTLHQDHFIRLSQSIHEGFRAALPPIYWPFKQVKKSSKQYIQHACQNIWLYCHTAHVTFDPKDLCLITQLIHDCWPHMSVHQIDQIVAGTWAKSDTRHLNQLRLNLTSNGTLKEV